MEETVQSWQDLARADTVEGEAWITMNELINIIVQKTGISQENAQKTVQVTVDFLKSKLPAPIAGQLDSFLSGGATGLTDQAGGFLKGKLGGLVGAKT